MSTHSCVYGIIVTKFIYREFSWSQLWNVGVTSMYLTAQIMIIVAAAGCSRGCSR
jgi:C4-dicarboxylate transporter DctM subunit